MKVSAYPDSHRLDIWNDPKNVGTLARMISAKVETQGITKLGDATDRQVSLRFSSALDVERATDLAQELGATVTSEHPPPTGRYA